MQKKLHVKKDDTVMVIAGKDKGKTGKVIQTEPNNDKVLVEGINILTKHIRPRRENQQSGIFKQEGSIHVSNVLLYCPKCKKGVRAGKKELTDGSKVRICSKCGETFDK